MPESKKDIVVAWSILLFLILVWGSSFLLIKRSLAHFNYVEVGSLRLIIAAVSLIPFAFKHIKTITKKQWLILFITGVCGNGFPAYFYAIAQQGLDSSVAGTLNSLTTLFTLILGLSFFKLKAKWFNILGVFIGLIGAVGLINISGAGNFNFNAYYASFIIMATIGYAINVNIVKTYLNFMNPVLITTYALISISIPATIILFSFTDIGISIQEPGAWKGIGYLSILAVIGTSLSLVLFNKLIQLTSSIFAASVTYMIPIVAILWGILDGEPFNLIYILWIILILLGVFLVNKKKMFSSFKKNTLI